MLWFVTDQCHRTGTEVLSFTIRSIALPFLLVQHHFSQAKMNILVCFPCGVHYLSISLSLYSKVGVHWPAPGKFNRQVWALSSFVEQGFGYRTMTEMGDLSEGKAPLCCHMCECDGVSHCSGLALLRACISLCMGPCRGRATGNQPSWTPLRRRLFGLLMRENIPHPFISPTLYL